MEEFKTGSFVYKFFDKELPFNLEDGLLVYDIFSDFADFLDKSNGSYEHKMDWFCDVILSNYCPKMYSFNDLNYKLLIDLNKKTVIHNLENNLSYFKDEILKIQYYDAEKFILEKEYKIIKDNNLSLYFPRKIKSLSKYLKVY